MDKFIAQKDLVCDSCEAEIPRGAWFYIHGDDNVCEDCKEQIEDDLWGETYG